MIILFINYLHSITELISNSVEANTDLTYILICLAMFIENIVPPIPSEIIMPLGGFLVFQGKLNFFILVLFGLIGTVVGAIPWYYLGKFLNEKKLSNFIDNKGKFFGITKNDISKTRRWFDKYGTSLVFWGRLVPGIRTLISVPAGIELMPFGKFLIWTTLGSLIWVSGLTVAGYFFAENYGEIENYIDNFKVFLFPLFIALILFFIFKMLKTSKKEN